MMAVSKLIYVKDWVLDCLEGTKVMSEKRLIEKMLMKFNLSESDMKNNAIISKLTKAKSLVGSAINELINTEAIVKNSEGMIHAVCESSDLFLLQELQEYIVQILKEKKMKRKDVLASCEEYFLYKNTGKNVSKIIADMKKTGEILVQKDYMRYNRKADFTDEQLNQSLIIELNKKGDLYFQAYSMSLISQHVTQLQSSRMINSITDTGIDGVIEYKDIFGVIETLVVKCKTKEKGVITVNELREFKGSALLENSTKEIFITTSTFNNEAKRYASKNRSLICIDKDDVFAMSKHFGMGIVKNKVCLESSFSLVVKSN